MLVLGPGTIGTLAAQFARAAGAEVHVLGEREPSLSFARSLGLDGVWTAADLPPLAFDAVIDASTAASLPALALELVEPGKRVVLHRDLRHPEHDRHPDDAAQGRDRGRHPVRLAGVCPVRWRPTRRARSIRVRSSPRPSGSTRWATCWRAAVPPAPAPGPRSTSTRCNDPHDRNDIP